MTIDANVAAEPPQTKGSAILATPPLLPLPDMVGGATWGGGAAGYEAVGAEIVAMCGGGEVGILLEALRCSVAD